ncbi:allulose-6-phosphate 3-epimerase, partial [Streptococcus agalactiae]|nr:allulose-6-phosphate 3-epimerase [Streptococcus agalactiae]
GSSSRKTFKKIDEAGPDIYIVGRSGLFALTDNISESWDIMTNDYFEMTGKKLN